MKLSAVSTPPLSLLIFATLYLGCAAVMLDGQIGGGFCFGTGCPGSGSNSGSGGGASGSYSAASATYTTAVFMPPGGGLAANATESSVQGTATTSGAISNFSATVGTAPGGSASLAFTWRLNGVSQTLTCTITGAAKSCSDLTHTFPIVPGDLVDIQVVGTTSPSATTVVLQWGTPGVAGAAGAPGQSVTATAESAGVNCTYGGIKFVSSSGTSYACNGVPGTNGTNGQSVTAVSESAGVNCTYGGWRLTSISGTSYVCNGAAGTNGINGAPGVTTNGGIDCQDATGSTTAYTCPTPSPVPGSYVPGQLLAFTPQITSTAAVPTVNVAGLGVKNLKGSDGNNLPSALTGGVTYMFEYTAGAYRQTGGGSGSSGIGNVSASCAGPATSCPITITSLNLSSSDSILLGCKTASSVVTITGYSVTGSSPINTITPTYASASGVVCTVSASSTTGGSGGSGFTFQIGAVDQGHADKLNIVAGNCITALPTLVSGVAGIQYDADLACLLPPVQTSTSGPVADPGGNSVFQVNNAAGALTFNLPVGVAGMQRCYRNAPGKSGVITVAVPSGNTIDLAGVNGTTSTGTLVSGGALGDAVCLWSDTANHWMASSGGGTWGNN